MAFLVTPEFLHFLSKVFSIVLAVIVAGFCIALWYNTYVFKPNPASSSYSSFRGRDYSVPRTGTLDDYLQARNTSASNVKMKDLQVATATLGGIFTESLSATNPFLGTVIPDAVELQIRAGARAIVFDIWPDPADPSVPTIAAMKEDAADGPSWLFGKPAWWLAHGGLDKGTGKYSNWKLISRNKVRAGSILKSTVDTAFTVQAADPFFIILCLHGAMTTDYLNTLAEDLRVALNGRGMSATARPGLLNPLCNATADQFKEKVCVIVCPDLQSGFQSLPNVNTYQQFATALATTNLINYTNILQTQPNTLLYSPDNLNALTQDTTQPCDASSGAAGILVPPPQAGFCVVQPSIGTSSSNDQFYNNGSLFATALKTGAQFVAVNLFSTNESGTTLETFFSPSNFGTYSFVLKP